MNADIDEMKLLVDLTLAKVSILKLKPDYFTWRCQTDATVMEQLEDALLFIDELIAKLRADKAA